MSGVRDTLLFFFRLFDRELIALLLTLPRIYAFMAASQLLNSSMMPRIARTATILSLSIVATPINLAYVDGFDRSIGSFALYFGKEYALGFVLGYLVAWIFWVVQAAGALIDNQRGASMASSMDPLQGHETSPLGIAFSQVFITYVFITGAVLPILGLMYQSFVIWPATRPLPVITDLFPAMMLNLFDHSVKIVVILAAPIVAIMFLAEFALAMVSRFAPQIQVFVLAMPIKSGLAMFVLIFYFQTLLPYAAGQTSLLRSYSERLYAIMQAAGTVVPIPPPPPTSPGPRP